MLALTHSGQNVVRFSVQDSGQRQAFLRRILSCAGGELDGGIVTPTRYVCRITHT